MAKEQKKAKKTFVEVTHTIEWSWAINKSML
jgi:hypothetical protein